MNAVRGGALSEKAQWTLGWGLALSQEVPEAPAAGPLSFERLDLEVESLEELSDGPWLFRA